MGEKENEAVAKVAASFIRIYQFVYFANCKKKEDANEKE